jgi:hypothetical protein
MTEQQPDLIDFVALSKVLTTEQEILAALLRIEKLLTPPEAPKIIEAAPAPKGKPFGRK